MLIYHSAYDAYHCLFRMITLIDHVDVIEVDKARILDFYLVFPSLVSEIRMPHNYSEIKKVAKKYSNHYHDPISYISTFRDMHQIQLAAIRCLAATALIEIESLEKGIIKRTDKEIPDGLLLSMRDFLNGKEDIYIFIIDKLAKFHLTGKDGLKHRTSLMEYRYDFP
ncbi:ABC-three component system middle component 5 [Serratia oryzae]|uniref:ABC-three component system middle component 5 n=1 Tax=Serratia oryzae TaxID=2034155 RepID=UPI0012E2EA85|nr:ABC-three component system middle component 5 [Serratia oryzae]